MNPMKLGQTSINPQLIGGPELAKNQTQPPNEHIRYSNAHESSPKQRKSPSSPPPNRSNRPPKQNPNEKIDRKQNQQRSYRHRISTGTWTRALTSYDPHRPIQIRRRGKSTTRSLSLSLSFCPLSLFREFSCPNPSLACAPSFCVLRIIISDEKRGSTKARHALYTPRHDGDRCHRSALPRRIGRAHPPEPWMDEAQP